jgi:hypothetical protein
LSSASAARRPSIKSSAPLDAKVGSGRYRQRKLGRSNPRPPWRAARDSAVSPRLGGRGIDINSALFSPNERNVHIGFAIPA